MTEEVMVNVADVVEVLPQASVAVKITVALPAAPHEGVSTVKLFVQVTALQISVAFAPPLLFNQLFKSVVLPCPSQTTDTPDAGVVILGATVSMILKVALVVAVLPQASVAVKITVALPAAPQPVIPVKLLVQVTALQLSVAKAPPLKLSQRFKEDKFPVPLH